MAAYQNGGNVQILNNDDPTKSQPEENMCRTRFIKFYSIIFLVVMPIVSVVFIGLALFYQPQTIFNEYGLPADCLLIFTYIGTVFGIISVVCSDNDHHSDSAPHKKHSYIAITFLFILGVGDALFTLTRSGDQLILIINQNFTLSSHCYRNIAVSTTENFLKTFCQLIILMFILYQLHKDSKEQKSPVSKFFHTCLAMYCLIQWLQILLQEVYEDEKKQDSCISTEDQDFKSFNEITPYLYPLGLEFRLACFIELLIISERFLDEEKNLNHNLVDRLETARNPIWQKVSNCWKCVPSFPICCTKTQVRLKKINKVLAKTLVPASGILLVTFSIAIVMFEEFNNNSTSHLTASISYNKADLTTLISKICEVILAGLISIHSIYSLGKLCKAENNQASASTDKGVNIKFKIDFVCLLIASVFLWAYCAITFVGSVSSYPKDNLTKHIKGLAVAASIIPIIQSIIQLISIWKVRQCRKILTEGINDMWIILSFAIWILDTFSAKEYNRNQIQSDFYGNSWDVLAPIFIPIAIFFRFHSCIIFANIKAEAYWD